MYTSISNILFGALVASSAVYATPLDTKRYQASTWSPDSTSTSSSATAAATLAASTNFPPPVAAVQAADPALITQLETAVNTVARFKTIQEQNVPLKFPFNNGPNTGKGGKISVASRANFPLLVGTNIAAAVGFIEPCGMNTLHTHPRAAEFLTVVQGQITTGFILENGLTTEFNTTLDQFEGTVFPQGSVHFQFNPNCSPAVFVAGLNHEDPGATQIAQTIFEIDDRVLEATLGFQEPIRAGAEIAKFKSGVPANVAKGIEQCLATCPQAANA